MLWLNCFWNILQGEGLKVSLWWESLMLRLCLVYVYRWSGRYFEWRYCLHCVFTFLFDVLRGCYLGFTWILNIRHVRAPRWNIRLVVVKVELGIDKFEFDLPIPLFLKIFLTLFVLVYNLDVLAHDYGRSLLLPSTHFDWRSWLRLSITKLKLWALETLFQWILSKLFRVNSWMIEKLHAVLVGSFDLVSTPTYDLFLHLLTSLINCRDLRGFSNLLILENSLLLLY